MSKIAVQMIHINVTPEDGPFTFQTYPRQQLPKFLRHLDDVTWEALPSGEIFPLVEGKDRQLRFKPVNHRTADPYLQWFEGPEEETLWREMQQANVA